MAQPSPIPLGIVLCGLLLTSAAAADLEIALFPESTDYVNQTVPVVDDVFEARLDDAGTAGELVFGRPLDSVNLRDSLPVENGFPETLYAGFIGRITASDQPSDTLAVSGEIRHFSASGGYNGPHFLLVREMDLYRMAGKFLAVAAFATPQRYPIDKLLTAKARMVGFGAKIAVVVGDSKTDTWWVSDAKEIRAREEGRLELPDIGQSMWQILDPKTLEPGDSGSPESFDRAGLLLQQGLHVNEELERKNVGNTGFTAFSITIAE